MANFVSPPRNGGRAPQQTSHDPRGSMPRRFTTDSGRVPTLSSMTAALASPPRGLGLDPAPEYNNVSLLTAARFESPPQAISLSFCDLDVKVLKIIG